jgi:hypothetical protein
MTFTIRQNTLCRAYDIEMDNPMHERHLSVIADFVERGVAIPKGGVSIPLYRGKEIVGRKHVFFLNEEVCDEYEKRMRHVETDIEREIGRALKTGGR